MPCCPTAARVRSRIGSCPQLACIAQCCRAHGHPLLLVPLCATHRTLEHPRCRWRPHLPLAPTCDAQWVVTLLGRGPAARDSEHTSMRCLGEAVAVRSGTGLKPRTRQHEGRGRGLPAREAALHLGHDLRARTRAQRGRAHQAARRGVCGAGAPALPRGWNCWVTSGGVWAGAGDGGCGEQACWWAMVLASV